MKRVWQTAAKVLAGLLVTAVYAMPQGYTVSARPGALNYIEGNAYLNGRPVSDKGLRAVFLSANDVLSTDAGKAEVLLTPGVFLRIGDNSAVKMVSPSLTGTQVEVTRGEAMVEAAGLMKENDIQVLDHNGTIRIEKDGLYRFTAGNPPTAAVLEGKAEVFFEGQRIELAKGHETVIGSALKAEKFDPKKEDELYAWSNIRSQYDAASSYQTAKNMSINSSNSDWWGYGFGGYSPGWLWNSGFNSWAWLPGDGAFYSPFGYGFYAPGVVGYAPIVNMPVYGGGTYWKNHPSPVPVNPKNPPAVGAVASSPASYAAARVQAAHSFAATGFTASNGTHVSAGSAFSGAASSGASHASGGGVSGGGHASGGFSGAGAGGGHAGGGGGHR